MISRSRLVAASSANRGGDYPKMPAAAPFPVSQSKFFIVGRLGGGRLPVNRIIMEPQIRSSISKGGGKSPKSFLRTARADFCAREQVFTPLRSSTRAPEGGVIPRTTQVSVGSSRCRWGANPRTQENCKICIFAPVLLRFKGGWRGVIPRTLKARGGTVPLRLRGLGLDATSHRRRPPS
jgi:hypothetical protein